MVRITTWNVNGIRNPFGYQPWRESRSFSTMFDILEADIVIMQELKIQRKDLRDDMVLVPGWDCYFSLPKHKKGYSGVGIYTRQSACVPIRAEEGLLGVLCPPGSTTPYRELADDACIGGYPTPSQVADLGVDPAALDGEGRCVVIEFPAFVLFGVYSPANSNGLRDDFRYGFICALDTRIRNLAKMGKYVVLTGDLNVSREEIDTARAEEAMREEGLTRDDYLNAPNRRIFNQLLENGQVPGARDEGREAPVLWDICREFHPTRAGMFTHWEQKINARPGNFGSRIDFVLCSIEMKTWFAESNIQEGLMGSDHCPVYAFTKDLITWQGNKTHILDVMNPPDMFKDGKRQREFTSARDALPMSGKMLPEFDKRRSIKDMFTRKPTLSKTESNVESKPGEAESIEALKTDLKPTSSAKQISENTSSSTKLEDGTASQKKAEKRRASTTSPAKPVKRTKSNLANSQPLTKGQQSLKGFFTSKPAVSAPMIESQPLPSASPPSATPKSANTLPPSSASPSANSESFVDPEASREGWTKLFSKKPDPRCEGHAEPCKSLTTKKPGANCGRQFWICARPLGPTGQKEVGTQWRCGTFIWASDWKSNDGND
ncbi:AP endonuclease 2 [Lophiostoma macrostomum CBS 122681]|uniref:DNA-(apurinic or apyrimidinic site) endonuclease 2 n=1 Tax=Lophiostoma macrostomum CBS 122681 TaxID=1314788 RepID=A0A6A6T577_9PLEO|nr:AP endonuclease 2 [Lophiostoma macrostomum CBS 122681]